VAALPLGPTGRGRRSWSGAFSAAIARVWQELADRIDRVRFAQFLVFRQGDALKRYARGKGLCLIGDLPFFVADDSSDIWTDPDLFLLDDRHKPRFVAGVSPEYFSADGQLWQSRV
jgi:4-alpha-glucanotransferase